MQRPRIHKITRRPPTSSLDVHGALSVCFPGFLGVQVSSRRCPDESALVSSQAEHPAGLCSADHRRGHFPAEGQRVRVLALVVAPPCAAKRPANCGPTRHGHPLLCTADITHPLTLGSPETPVSPRWRLRWVLPLSGNNVFLERQVPSHIWSQFPPVTVNTGVLIANTSSWREQAMISSQLQRKKSR